MWQGFGTDCDPNDCPQPQGACCFENGDCAYILEAECIDQGGVWQGFGTDCDPNDCPQPTVCCVDLDCFIVYSEDECTTLGGMWYPAEVSCDPNPCETTPTNGDTWGSIKALFR